MIEVIFFFCTHILKYLQLVIPYIFLDIMAEQRANSPEVITDRAKIIALWERNLPVSVTARQTGFHRSTVHKWIRRWQQEGSVRTKPRSGRPKATMLHEDHSIVEASQVSLDFSGQCYEKNFALNRCDGLFHC